MSSRTSRTRLSFSGSDDGSPASPVPPVSSRSPEKKRTAFTTINEESKDDSTRVSVSASPRFSREEGNLSPTPPDKEDRILTREKERKATGTRNRFAARSGAMAHARALEPTARPTTGHMSRALEQTQRAKASPNAQQRSLAEMREQAKSSSPSTQREYNRILRSTSKNSEPQVVCEQGLPLFMSRARKTKKDESKFLDIIDVHYVAERDAAAHRKMYALPDGLQRNITDLFGMDEELDEPAIPLTPLQRWQGARDKMATMQHANAFFQEAATERRARFEILKEMMYKTTATTARRDQQRSAAEKYRSSLVATQAHGKESKQAEKANRLYISDMKLACNVPKTESWLVKSTTLDAQALVKQEIEYFLHRVCPEVPVKVTITYDPIVDERNVMHVMVDFTSAAAAQGALRALRQEGPPKDAEKCMSWRYCGLAWEPDTICGKTSKVSRPPSFHKHTQLFNLTDLGREQLEAEQEPSKQKSRFTFSAAPTSFSDAGRQRIYC